VSDDAGGDEGVASVVEVVTTVDGRTQLRRAWVVDEPVATCLLVHGINEHSGRYERVGRRFAAARIHTIGFDHRGFGRSSGPRGHVDRLDQYVDDVAERFDSLAPFGVPRVLLGHSMGGLIALRAVLSRRVHPDLLVLSGPALGDSTPDWLHKLARPLSWLVPRLRIPSPIPTSALSRDPVVCAAFDGDPLVEHRTSVKLGAELFAAMDWVRAHIDELDVETLVVHGGDDEVVPTQASEILEQVPCVQRRVLSGLRHEPFNEPEGPQVIDDVVSWIRGGLDIA
jgi:alpha-beta hydrolase superfamily lysophospholipase